MNRDQMNAAFGVTDEQLDSLAADYEAGDWKGAFSTSYAV